MEGDKNKTVGDVEGTVARAEDGRAGAETGVAEENESAKAKEKSKLEKLAAKRAAEFIANTHMMLIFAFMEKNPGVALEVFDLKTRDEQVGRLENRGGRISVGVGINFYGIDIGMNDRRFKLTPASARLISAFETHREMKQVMDDSRARFMTAWNPAPEEKVEIKEDLPGKIRKILFRILEKRGNFAYVTRKKRGGASFSFKCSAKDGLSLIELSRQAGIQGERGHGAKGFKIDDQANVHDWLDLLREYGYKGKNCMPIEVKIEENGKFIMFFPEVDGGDKSGKP